MRLAVLIIVVVIVVTAAAAAVVDRERRDRSRGEKRELNYYSLFTPEVDFRFRSPRNTTVRLE